MYKFFEKVMESETLSECILWIVPNKTRLKPSLPNFRRGQILNVLIFKEGELLKNSVVAKFATTATDGKTYIGASLKDLGKKWFGFSKMDSESFEMMGRLK